MRFENIEELPQAVRDALPKKAQEVYLKACNRASGAPAAMPGAAVEHSPNAQAHKAAWQAVKKLYRKRGNRWVRNRPSQRADRLFS
jgi:cation transport regulator